MRRSVGEQPCGRQGWRRGRIAMSPMRRAGRPVALLGLALTLVLASVAPLWAQTVITTVPVGVLPEGLAADPTTNRIYTADQVSNTTAIVDGATNTRRGTLDV